MAKLTGAELQRLTDTITDRYIEAFEIEQIVYGATGDRLYHEYVGEGMPLKRMVYRLLEALESSGTLVAVLVEVCRDSPYRQDVVAVIREVVPEAAQPRASAPALALQHGGVGERAPPRGDAPGLERNVRPHLVTLDVEVWRSRLHAAQRRVCRLELDGRPLGTGFLVGADTVLTNWHVAAAPHAAGVLGEVVARFDYLLQPDGTTDQGIVEPLATAPLLADSPYSPAELTPTPLDPPPTPDELDYALLRLANPVGNDRGVLALTPQDRIPAANMPILILQHPHGGPMKLAMDTSGVIGANAGGTRLQYRTNTEAGSSGSPCFDMEFNLLALHHFGDPAWSTPTYNQGIPVGILTRHLIARGQSAVLEVAA